MGHVVTGWASPYRAQSSGGGAAWWVDLLVLSTCAVVCAVWQFLAEQFGYKRYLVGTEFVLAVVCLAMGWRWLGTAVLLAAGSLEVALGAASVLRLFSLEQVVSMMGFAEQANTGYQQAAFVGLGGLVLLSGVLVGLGPRCRGRTLIWALVGMVLAQFSMSFADGNFWRPTAQEQRRMLFGSTAWHVHEVLSLNSQVFELSRSDNLDFVAIKAPSAVNTAWPEGTPSARKVLLVLAESWGLPQVPGMLDRQVAPIAALAGAGGPVKDLKLGAVGAVGVTVIAEFRELCAKVPTKLKLKEVSQEHLVGCLPHRLKGLGFRTVGLHAAAAAMYDRKFFYPVLGIDRLLFFDQLEARQPQRCHSFPGLCDHQLFSVVRDEFKEARPAFVYWLTLNSHIPYDPRDLSSARPELCQGLVPADDPGPLCTYHQLHHQFFEGLASLVRSDEMRGAEVLVVGDHAPPFHDSVARRSFVGDRVPYLHFRVH